ncbi:MAG: hypothetical protein IKC69_04200 [Clostridia bacterium]|nr:hypothetical protein [Clostridia bacterium]
MKLFRTILAGVLLLAMILPLASCTPVLIRAEETETLEETAPAVQQTQEALPRAKKYKIKELEGYLKLIGERTAYASNDLLPLEWAGSGFELKFEAPAGGTSVIMSSRFNYASRFVVFVDGELQEDILALEKGNVDTVLATVSEGVHTVRVEKDTEQGTTYNNYNNIVSLSFDGTPLQADQSEKELYLEFIGDNYFVGYGALGSTADSTNISAESSYHASMPYLVAKALDADTSVVARSGIGITTKVGGMTLPVLYGQQNGYRDAELFYSPDRAPDAIIINAGNHDSTSTTAADYILKSEEFIDSIRAYYGDEGEDIPVIWLYGTVYYTRRAAEIQTLQKRNDNVYAFQCEYGRSGSAAKDVVRYPNAAEHQKTVDIFVPFLQNLLQQSVEAPEVDE